MSSDQPYDIDVSDSVDIFDLIYPGARRYLHKPLQTPDSIRVLELLSGNSGSALSCRIHEIHRTNSDVDFEAISYVWGSPIPACYIHEVESNSMLSITESLYLALRALRYPDRSRIVWADAVCINQSDNDEKSNQVQNMGSVYATASMVIVWLSNGDDFESFLPLRQLAKVSYEDCRKTFEGPYSWRDDEGYMEIAQDRELEQDENYFDATNFETLSQLRKLSDEECCGTFQHLMRFRDVSKFTKVWKIEIVSKTEKVSKTKKPAYPFDTYMKAILRIIKKEWFTRLWIIQEFVLARDVQFWACHQHINYKILESAMAKCHEKYWRLSTARLREEHSPSYIVDSEENYGLANTLFKLRTRWRDESVPSSRQISLYDCCRIVHKDPPQCTDQRDLIYALLGLAKAPTTIVPNYSLSVASVFLEFTWSEIVNGNIEILRNAEFLGKDDSIPSFFWGDSEATQRSREEPPSFVYRLRPRLRFAVGFGATKSAGASRAVCAEVIRPASIQIRGVMVGRISECRALINVTARMPETKRDYKNMLENQRVYMTPEDCFEDLTILLWPTSTNLLEVYRSAQTQTSQLIKRGLAPRGVTEETLRERFWRTISQHLSWSTDMPKDFGRVPQVDIHAREFPKFFITTNGYMGKATDEARAGDAVVIFDGSKVPFVIRNAHSDSGIRWKLVSECYADGWMDGSYHGHEVRDDPDQECTAADTETNTDPWYKKRTLVSEYFVLC